MCVLRWPSKKCVVEADACYESVANVKNMGRLSKTGTNTGRPSFRVHYSKLVDEYSSNCDALKFMPSLPEYLSYCCHQCGHTQKLQVHLTFFIMKIQCHIKSFRNEITLIKHKLLITLLKKLI